MVKGEMPDWMVQKRKEFADSLKKVKVPGPGTYEIEVAEVLDVGEYCCLLPETAIVKDTRGKIWEVPEDRNYDKPGNRLISRWDVKVGMKLKLVVMKEENENVVSEVLVL